MFTEELLRCPDEFLSFNCWLFQAQFDASELITQRELVSQRVSEELHERATSFGILCDDISLVRDQIFPSDVSYLVCSCFTWR
jgi:hypothetical protein